MSHLGFALFLLTVILLVFESEEQHIQYNSGLSENARCSRSGALGRCQKISHCLNEYQNFRSQLSNLAICKYDTIYANILVCCPDKQVTSSPFQFAPNTQNVPVPQNGPAINNFLAHKNNPIAFNSPPVGFSFPSAYNPQTAAMNPTGKIVPISYNMPIFQTAYQAMTQQNKPLIFGSSNAFMPGPQNAPILQNVPNKIRIITVPEPEKIPFNLDLTHFETCRNVFLKYRERRINIARFEEAFFGGKIRQTMEDCMFINNYRANYTGGTRGCIYIDGKFSETRAKPYYGRGVKKGDRPNMAAIGCTQSNKKVSYVCGGSVLAEKFIVTAAHCKFHKGKIADTVRLGDRYLLSSEDDEHAQQLKIQKFINHPNYNSAYNYNDIAMIKTVEQIVFNKFVVPSCISDINVHQISKDDQLTVAGYGQTENNVLSTILLELDAELVSNDECKRLFQYDTKLPNGILDSQLCVKNSFGSFDFSQNGIYPDTCYGDSGSPLQYKTPFEIFPNDFSRTYKSDLYMSSNVIGIVSFGASCGFDFPSVYTKLSYYRSWIKSMIETQ